MNSYLPLLAIVVDYFCAHSKRLLYQDPKLGLSAEDKKFVFHAFVELKKKKKKTLFIHGILSLQSGILKSRALYNILIRSTNYALI